MKVLVGDIGGTKARFALCEREEGQGLTLKVEQKTIRRFSSTQFGSLRDLLRKYFQETGIQSSQVDAACFGVPGPVLTGARLIEMVNLPWKLDAEEVERELGVKHVYFLNDLEAAAHGLEVLERVPGALHYLRGEARQRGNRVLISPGTGLGEALLTWDVKTNRYIVNASEGGHCDFGPQNEEQIELLRWLWPKHAHASWEHVASGPAIHRIYRFLKESGHEKEPEELEPLFSDPHFDPSPVISERAIKGNCPISLHTMDLWLFCLGAEAGNLALKNLSAGGVFIGGGVVSAILPLFNREAFLSGFNTKGRMSKVLAPYSIVAVTDPDAGLYGAASYVYTNKQ